MASVTLRVRPGYVHGAHKQFREGDLFAVDVETAGQLLAAFGDKLEQVGESQEPASNEPAAVVDTAVEDKQPDKPIRRKQREAGDS